MGGGYHPHASKGYLTSGQAGDLSASHHYILLTISQHQLIEHSADVSKQGAVLSYTDTSLTNGRIKCNACDVLKGSNNYSTKKLELLSEHIMKLKNRGKTYDAKVMQYIPCVNCTQKQVCELTCFMCDKTMGLDRFAKTQRKKPDQAVRMSVMEISCS
jgi:hypothetical protein